MAYNTPTFNLRCAIWHGQALPATRVPTNPPDLDSPCQLRLYKTAFHSPADVPIAARASGTVALCLPQGADARGFYGLGSPADHASGDLVEVPIGSGRLYAILYVEDVAKGFANEYRMARLTPLASPVPIP